MQILVPISGTSSFFPKDDFYFPKPLIEVSGRPMIEVVVKQLQLQFSQCHFIFIIDSDDAISFSLDKTLRLLTNSNCTIVERSGVTSGALCSCLLSIDCIDLDSPLLIANSDQVIDFNISSSFASFADQDASAGVLTFDSIHPRWSYIVDDGKGVVVQAFEKKVASRNAIAGIYYFKNASIFFDASKKVILNDANVDGLYYISSSLNEVILDGGSVYCTDIPYDSYHSFYSPSKIEEYERLLLKSKKLVVGDKCMRPNVVIPAAGMGSRFADNHWRKPKPFIDIDGKPMIDHVIDNVSKKDYPVSIILRSLHVKNFPNIASRLSGSGHNIICSDKLTEGTACTVLLAREVYDNDQALLIANSDQLVDFNVANFVDDCHHRDLDGSILVFKDPTRNPKWSFVRLNEFGFVLEVAEKRPISDMATVGIYLFSKGSSFVSAALDMILSNDRVNNEFYTAPVYNYMISKGARIGIYEVPMDSMSGLGTPDDLIAFMSKHSMTPSLDSPLP